MCGVCVWGGVYMCGVCVCVVCVGWFSNDSGCRAGKKVQVAGCMALGGGVEWEGCGKVRMERAAIHE